MRRLLVLGASGFSGRHLLAHVQKHAKGLYWVIAADIRPTETISGMYDEFVVVDATNKPDVEKVIEHNYPDYIVTLVGTFKTSGYEEFMKVNVDSTRSLLEACLALKFQPKKILLVGSAAEYGVPLKNPISEADPARPVSLYGFSKLVQTQLGLYYFTAHELPVLIARTFNITGQGISSDLSVGNFAMQIDSAKDGDSILVGNLETERDFLPIEEVVARYLLLLECGPPGQIFNVCSSCPVSMKSVLEKMINDSGKRLRLEIDPTRFKINDVPSIYGDSKKFLALRRSPTISQYV